MVQRPSIGPAVAGHEEDRLPPIAVGLVLVVGVAVAVLIGIPLVSLAVTAAVTVVALQITIIGAILGYLIGIPWSIWFRLRHGRWPES